MELKSRLFYPPCTMYIQMNYVLPGLNNRVFWYFYQDLNGKMMLYEAVKKEKVAAVLTLLDAGAGKHHILHFRISLLRCGYFWVMRTCVSAQTERGNSLGGATKKRKISRTTLPINLHFSVDLFSNSLDPARLDPKIGKSPLHLVCERADPKLLTILVDHIASSNADHINVMVIVFQLFHTCCPCWHAPLSHLVCP